MNTIFSLFLFFIDPFIIIVPHSLYDIKIKSDVCRAHNQKIVTSHTYSVGFILL